MSEKFEHPEIFEKYAKIDVLGRKAIKNRDIKEFEGFSESLGNRFNVSLLPDKETEILVNERLVSEIEKMEAELGIKFSLAGRDFPFHSTVMEGQFGEGEEDKKDNIFGSLEEQISQSGLPETLNGQEIKFKYVLLDRGNILLTSVLIPETVSRARENLDTTYSANDLKPLPMQNILHMSVGRISGLPEDKEKLNEYKKRMTALRHKISSDPITVKVGDVYVGNTLKLLKGDAE